MTRPVFVQRGESRADAGKVTKGHPAIPLSPPRPWSWRVDAQLQDKVTQCCIYGHGRVARSDEVNRSGDFRMHGRLEAGRCTVRP